MRALPLATALTLIATVAACSEPSRVDGLAEPVTPAPAASSPTSTSAAPTSAAPTGATPANTATKPAGDPCPVSAATLFRALRTSEIYERAGEPDGLAKPACYRGFAYAESTFRRAPDGEIAAILFRFDTDVREWRALNLGTGDVCDGYAPQSVRDRLNETSPGGC